MGWSSIGEGLELSRANIQRGEFEGEIPLLLSTLFFSCRQNNNTLISQDSIVPLSKY